MSGPFRIEDEEESLLDRKQTPVSVSKGEQERELIARLQRRAEADGRRWKQAQRTIKRG